MPTKVPPNAKPKAKIEKRADAEAYPATRIDEDFVARALAGLPADGISPSESLAAASQADRKPTEPLPGIMSLGAQIRASAP
jgi:hypothetical protein